MDTDTDTDTDMDTDTDTDIDMDTDREMQVVFEVRRVGHGGRQYVCARERERDKARERHTCTRTQDVLEVR